MNLWWVAAASVSGEGTAPIDVGSVTGSTPTSVSAPGFLAQVYGGPTFAFLRMLGGPSCRSQGPYGARRWFVSVEDPLRTSW